MSSWMFSPTLWVGGGRASVRGPRGHEQHPWRAAWPRLASAPAPHRANAALWASANRPIPPPPPSGSEFPGLTKRPAQASLTIWRASRRARGSPPPSAAASLPPADPEARKDEPQRAARAQGQGRGGGGKYVPVCGRAPLYHQHHYGYHGVQGVLGRSGTASCSVSEVRPVVTVLIRKNPIETRDQKGLLRAALWAYSLSSVSR